MEHIDEYFDHVFNGNSLLARIYGLFQVKMKGIIPINFILMANTIKSTNNYGLKVFDLKGSLINRLVTRKEGLKQTKKDRNLLHCKDYRTRTKQNDLLLFKNSKDEATDDIGKIIKIMDYDS